MMIPPAANNVPFGGIPEELKELSDKILSKEPETPIPSVDFSQQPDELSDFSLKSFLKPHSWALLFAFGLVVIASFAQQAGPMITAYAIDNGIKTSDKQILVYCFIAYVLSIGVGIVSSYLRIRFTGNLAQVLLYELRVKVFSQFQRLSLNFYTGEKSGRLLTRMTSDIEALSNLFTDGLVNLAVQGVTLLIISCALFYMNSELALVILILVVPVMLVSTLKFKSYSDKGYLLVRDKIAEVMADLQENLAGYKTVIAANRRLRNVFAHINIVDSHKQANGRMSLAQNTYDAGTTFVNIVGQVLILLYGYHLIQNNELTIGELIAFQLFLSNFFTPLQSLVQLYSSFQSANAAVTKLSDLFSEIIEVPEKENPVTLKNFEGSISFKNVDFYYDKKIPVLKNINLNIKAGESVAFVGPTGAGKSTIAKLITRFYDPQSGAITVDGIDLKDVSFESLRKHIAVVPQEAFLFYGNIRSNLAFSNPEISDEEILKACDLMDLTPLINRQKGGLDAMLSERGSSLSSGEKQLLALARAFISKPKLLILDEATSNIDLASEAKVERALDIVLEGCTSIIIAHRLSTALRADKIAFIDHGQVLEYDSHEALIKKGGSYARFFETFSKTVEKHLDK
jgi:ATP-binding cassette subfamily B protein